MTTQVDAWDRIDKLADEAWRKKTGKTVLEKVSLAFLCYHSQVLNGRHQQWIENGYAEDDSPLLLAVLEEYPDVEPLKKTADNLREALEVKTELDELGAYNTEPNEEDWQEVIDKLATIDDRYYDGLNNRLGEALLEILR